MEPTIVLVTGANTGLGFETVKALYQSEKEYHIFLTGRSLDKAQDAVVRLQSEVASSKSVVTAFQLDVTDDDSISKAFSHIDSKFGKLDILINNAGANFDKPIHEGTLSLRQGWAQTWDVNVTSAHILTSTFMPALLRSSDPRLIFVTSGASSLEGTAGGTSHFNVAPPKGWPKTAKEPASSYRASKTGLNMLMRQWTKALENDGVKVFAVSPGLLATNLGGDPEFIKSLNAGHPSEGGDAVRKVVEGERDADAGKVVRFYRSPVQPW